RARVAAEDLEYVAAGREARGHRRGYLARPSEKFDEAPPFGRGRVIANEITAGLLGLVGSLLPVLAGLVASAMLVVDYTRPAPVFCVEGGGCDALKHTVYAAPLGIPLPIVGV